MFEDRAYIGSYRKGGFIDYPSAVLHANEMVRETGQPYEVVEITLRCRLTKKNLIDTDKIWSMELDNRNRHP